jgi:S-adenosylmethionine:tRNA ribosyltransferase-isomerase
VKLSLFDYDLPRELIAQYPTRKREESRLLVLDRQSGQLQHRSFPDLIEYLRPGDALVVNNTKVFKARLLGRRPTGGQAEVFLVRRLEQADGEVWEALARPSRRLKDGETITFGEGHSVLLERHLGGGRWAAKFGSRTARARIVARYGHVPLPQYIGRDDRPEDIRRYQTVFANKEKVGAVAAPTAGFHLTRRLLRRIVEMDVEVCQITLHVGPGTFKPITVDNIERHTVDAEFAEISPEVAARLNRVRQRGGRVFAVGTTSVRTLESAEIVGGDIQPLAQEVDLYIKPGHRFRVVDKLVTNFHLPKSSLIVLASAFAGRERLLSAYREAIRERYRFYSYGDAMLIL